MDSAFTDFFVNIFVGIHEIIPIPYNILILIIPFSISLVLFAPLIYLSRQDAAWMRAHHQEIQSLRKKHPRYAAFWRALAAFKKENGAFSASLPFFLLLLVLVIGGSTLLLVSAPIVSRLCTLSTLEGIVCLLLAPIFIAIPSKKELSQSYLTKAEQRKQMRGILLPYFFFVLPAWAGLSAFNSSNKFFEELFQFMQPWPLYVLTMGLTFFLMNIAASVFFPID